MHILMIINGESHFCQVKDYVLQGIYKISSGEPSWLTIKVKSPTHTNCTVHGTNNCLPIEE